MRGARAIRQLLSFLPHASAFRQKIMRAIFRHRGKKERMCCMNRIKLLILSV